MHQHVCMSVCTVYVHIRNVEKDTTQPPFVITYFYSVQQQFNGYLPVRLGTKSRDAQMFMFIENPHKRNVPFIHFLLTDFYYHSNITRIYAVDISTDSIVRRVGKIAANF